jgi:hypothetical protein
MDATQELFQLADTQRVLALDWDNFNTADMPTTAGSLSLKGSIPASDAFQVRKLREAGASVPGEVEHRGVRLEPVRDGGHEPKVPRDIEGMDFSVHRRLILG